MPKAAITRFKTRRIYKNLITRRNQSIPFCLSRQMKAIGTNSSHRINNEMAILVFSAFLTC